MKHSDAELSPERIRAIRKSLGLTQVEAGELLGGGPRAFTKYEAGTTKPAAAVANLLRLLDSDPSALSKLTGRRPNPVLTRGTQPYEVTGRNISAFTERDLPVLLRRLLVAEARANGLPADGVHVASNVTTADGGEDGRISWPDGVKRTDYLPSRLCQFQVKAGQIAPYAAANEVLTRSGALKDMVRDALEQGGTYLMLCGHSYTQAQVAKRRKGIIDAIKNAGLSVRDEQVAFRDADQIADWVNRHPPVASWVLEQTQPGLMGSLQSWSQWAGRYEHDSSSWVEDKRLPELRAQLRQTVATPRSVVRVVGLAGVGKSRLILEALGPIEEDTSLSDIVLYALESEAGSRAIKKDIQNLSNSGGRAVVVVDGCDTELQRDLSGMVRHSGSHLSLVTIEDRFAECGVSKGMLEVVEAPKSVIEGIVDQISPGHPSEDRRRLIHFSKGFPKIAFGVCESWNANTPIAHTTDDDLVERFVLGRGLHERGITLKTAKLLAAFGVVRFEDSNDLSMAEIAPLGQDLSEDEFYASVDDLVHRGIAKLYGRDAVLQPTTIALKLAELQWRAWQPACWDRVLAGTMSSKLKISAARRLTLLNTTNTAVKVTNHVCRLDGPLNGWEGISQLGHSEVLSFLAEISPAVVVRLIEDSLDEVELAAVDGDVRRNLVGALEKIAFNSTTFEDGARLLLHLAVRENESWDDNALGQFAALFPVFLGNTAASAQPRLAMLDEAADSDDPAQRLVAVDALTKGVGTSHFSRFVGPETQGARPALHPWRPKTWGEARAYVDHCVERLAELALQGDEAGAKARVRLGQEFRSLVGFGLIDTVERVVRRVCESVDCRWTEAQESLGHFLRFDSGDQSDDVASRVKRLVEEFEPASLASRVRFLVTEMPWGYPCGEDLDFDERDNRQLEAISNLAADIVAQPQVLDELLPQLSKGDHRHAWSFGKAIAESEASACDWFIRIRTAMVEVPEEERNYELLAGYLVGLSETAPDAVETFKREAAVSRSYAPVLPMICGHLGIKPLDVQLVVSALNSEILPPRYLVQWTTGRKLDEVSARSLTSLFDLLLDRNAETYTIAVELLSMYGYPDRGRLNCLRRHLLKAAANVDRWPQSLTHRSSSCFERIMAWMLSKGRADADARATALILAQKLTSMVQRGNEEFIKPLVPTLLAKFPEIAWPLIGQAILDAEPQTAWRFEHVLGDTRVGDERESVILHLPEETLFAWCHAHPDAAPAHLAVFAPILASGASNANQRLHPVMNRLLTEFGDRDDVLQGISQNMITFSWTGSLTTYFARYEAPFRELLDHPLAKVRHWARRTLSWLNEEIRKARDDDEEFEAQLET